MTLDQDLRNGIENDQESTVLLAGMSKNRKAQRVKLIYAECRSDSFMSSPLPLPTDYLANEARFLSQLFKRRAIMFPH